MKLKPDIRSLLDRCATWLRNTPEHERSPGHMRAAYLAAQQAAQKNATATGTSPRVPFHLNLRSIEKNCGIQYPMLVAYATTNDTDIPVPPALHASVNGSHLQNGSMDEAHHEGDISCLSELEGDNITDQDSQDKWVLSGVLPGDSDASYGDNGLAAPLPANPA